VALTIGFRVALKRGGLIGMKQNYNFLFKKTIERNTHNKPTAPNIELTTGIKLTIAKLRLNVWSENKLAPHISHLIP
jgi:hypothetical protein